MEQAATGPERRRPDRRAALMTIAAAATTPLFGPAARAAAPIGAVDRAEGDVFARLGAVRRLAARSEVMLGDLVWTEPRSRASLALAGGSRVHLGPEARLTIDRFVAEAGGDLTLGAGALVFDRPDDQPKLDLEIRTAFGLIGVRGTRFFAGRSRGKFGVFVARGRVEVSAAGVTRTVKSGEGVDMTRGGPPSRPTAWDPARADEAFASVLG